MHSGRLTLHLGAFVIDGVVNPDRLFSEDRKAAVERELTSLGFRMCRDETADLSGEESRPFFDDHRAQDYGHLGPILARAHCGSEGFDLIVGALGSCVVVLPREEPLGSPGEWAMSHELGPIVDRVSKAIASNPDAGFLPERPPHLLPAGRVLWWHRVTVDDTATCDDHCSSWESGVEGLPAGSVVVQLSPTVSLHIGDGYSYLHGDVISTEQIDDTLEGLFLATEDWLLADATNRAMRRFLRMSASPLAKSVGDATREATSLMRHGQTLELYLDDRDRHLAAGRRVVWKTARDAWGLDSELASLGSRVHSVAEHIAVLEGEARAGQDRRRNAVLFAIAVITSIQGLLLVYDFSVADDVTVEHPYRFVGAVATAGLAAVLAFLLGRGRSLRR